MYQAGAWTEYFSEMKFNLKTTPIVIVRWKDATEPFSGWVEFKDIIKKTAAGCFSIGWLVKDTEEEITLMADWCDDNSEEGGRVAIIPKGMVQETKYLKYHEAKKYN
jgi:hypothetical protein